VPGENVQITHKESRETEYGSGIAVIQGEKPDREFSRQIDARRKILRIAAMIRNPIRTYMSDYRFGIVIGTLLGSVIALMGMAGMFQDIFPRYPGEIMICLMTVVMLAPLMAAYE